MAVKIKYNPIKTTLGFAVSEAFETLSELAEEMRSWANSLEEKFSTTEKYQTVNNSADELEGLQEPDVPEECSEVDVTYQVGSKPKTPRWLRRDNAVNALSAGVSGCEEWLEAHEANDDGYAEIEQLKTDLEEAISTAEGVEFPGMMG